MAHHSIILPDASSKLLTKLANKESRSFGNMVRVLMDEALATRKDMEPVQARGRKKR